MMLLHQGLEFGLDIGTIGIRFKSEHLQGAPLCIENLASLRCRPRMTVAATLAVAQQVEGIHCGPTGGAKSPLRGAGAAAAERAHFPRRPMAGDRIFLIFGDGLIAHASEE